MTLASSSTGPFDLDRCVTLEALESMSEAERLAQLLPVTSLLPDHTAVPLDEREIRSSTGSSASAPSVLA